MGNKNSTIIIAEAGVNHNGDMQIAKELVKKAAQIGADIVKFQTFKAEDLSTSSAQKAAYQIRNTKDSLSQKEMLSKLEIDYDQHLSIINECNKHKIEFLSTAFDYNSIILLNRLNLKRIKIPSGEITNLPYLREIASLKLPVILSTGMSDLGEIEDAMNILIDAGSDRDLITVLHCTTDYPAPYEEVNLRAMNNIANAFGVKFGYSDHTIGIEVPIAAVALGASIIEKHLTLDKSLPGPDHKASLEPYEFEIMVKSIRNIEKSLGDGIKKATKSEINNKLIVRKSIVASSNIKAGEIFTEKNLACKRPFNGISPMRWNEIIGKKACKNFRKDEPISL